MLLPQVEASDVIQALLEQISQLSMALAMKAAECAELRRELEACHAESLNG